MNITPPRIHKPFRTGLVMALLLSVALCSMSGQAATVGKALSPHAYKTLTTAQQLMERGVDTVRRLRRGLANALRSAEKRWWREDQDRGCLSPRTLHRLCLERPSLDVFRTRAMVQGKSTAVSIVLDASGSMTTHKMAAVRRVDRGLKPITAHLPRIPRTWPATSRSRVPQPAA